MFISANIMEPHRQARGTIITPRRGEHPVPEDQFTHGQGRGSFGTGIEDLDLLENSGTTDYKA